MMPDISLDMVRLSAPIGEKRDNLDANLTSLFSVFLQVFSFADAVCNLMSTWLIVAMAIERMCVVYMPFRRNMWCRQRGAVIIIVSLVLFMSTSQVFR